LAIILHIDTATEFASVCLSDYTNIVSFESNDEQQNHASFLQPAIKKIMQEAKIDLRNIDAISVTNGPGSYTGLRVGLSSAKGLCFALNKPLITLNTLEVMAMASINQELGIGNLELENTLTIGEDSNKFELPSSNLLFCPMIDARRMEVFTGLYTNGLISIKDTQPLILNEDSFSDYLKSETIIFSGSGAAKAKTCITSSNAIFLSVQHSAKNMLTLSLKKFQENNFSDIAYTSPDYGKEFYTIPSKK
jgi:tRNA threonylcarbamoyladenosine biosynthesis protein TsaB